MRLEDQLDRLDRFVSQVRHGVKVGLRNWRRARVSRRRMRSRRTYALLGLLIVLAGTFAALLAYLAPSPLGQRLTINQLSALAAHKQLVTAVFHDQDAQITGVYSCTGSAPKKSDPSLPFAGTDATPPTCRTTSGAAPFWVAYPKSDTATAGLLQLATEGGAQVTVDPQTRKSEMRVVTTLVLPLMMLANVFVLFFTSGQSGGSGIGEVETFASIGKGRFSRRRKLPVTFADVAGADEAVAELKEVRDYLADPDKYKELGAQPPKGVLLIGPPGCGKTLLAKAVAGEVGVPFFSVAGAEFVESLVGVGAARVRDLFRRVRAVAPAVVFIDELDAAGRKRGHGDAAGGNEEREQTLNQILVEMDGFDVSAGIVVMAATNRPDILDPALLRPGRFDRHVTVDRPDLVGRVRILELHARGKPFGPGVDFSHVARRTPGFSGADLANVINEAALLAVRAGHDEIDSPELEEAIQRTLSGTARKGRVLNAEERKRAAFHESAHVIAAAATGRFHEVHRVSILASGNTLGTASIKADEEAAMLTYGQLHARIVTHLAGAAAEALVFGEPSTGSERDIELATMVARDMVTRYGMSDKLDLLRYLAPDVDAFLDADVPMGNISALTHQEIDAEMRRIISEARRSATDLLMTHRATLDALAARLEAEETLEGPDLEAVLTAVRPDVEIFGSLITGADGNGRVPAPTTAGA
jgi:cell division protease FtsH